MQGAGDAGGMIAPGFIVVGDDDDIGATKEFVVFRAPLVGAAPARRRR